MIQMMLQGAPGSQLDLAVVRHHKADPDKVVLNRVVVSEPPVADTLYENASILYLKPMTLDRDHVQQVEAKLKNMNKTGTKKVLLDLRDVASGDMSEAVRLANFFVAHGTLATLEGQRFPKQTFTAEADKALDANGPLVVLVNRGTSGPGELVAGAILDDKRGQLVGEKTFGEGSVQKTFELEGGQGAVILSVAKYASPSGKQFEDDAVTPGTLVASADDLGGDDEDDSTTAAKPNAAPKKPVVEVDGQLNKGLELLKAKAA
jgi:carboxyl-terminal processing protease